MKRAIEGLSICPHEALIDGLYIPQVSMPCRAIVNGDSLSNEIGAASILAKVERDKYIEELCKENPELVEKYGIDSNKGYGSKTHMDGIKKYGITKWHRRTFGLCKEFANI